MMRLYGEGYDTETYNFITYKISNSIKKTTLLTFVVDNQNIMLPLAEITVNLMSGR